MTKRIARLITILSLLVAVAARAGIVCVGISASGGAWAFDDCAPGASGNGGTFFDASGNGRHMTGNDGANNAGLTCQGNTVLTYPWGVE